MTRRYAVVGNPVRHSRSPWLHQNFARATQRDVVYAAYCVAADGFAAFAEKFFAGGGSGLNVTLPFKADALRFADRAGSFARRAGAANVLAKKDGEIVAYNTDGAGFLRALNSMMDGGAAGRKVLLLGAGGAARAAAFALADSRPAALWVFNRTAKKAAALAEQCGGEFVGEPRAGADIIINATSAGHSGGGGGGGGPKFPAEIFGGAKLACDLSYGAAAENFLRQARAGGAKKTADGGAMLAWQAALSFAIWEGVAPPVAALLPLLESGAGG